MKHCLFQSVSNRLIEPFPFLSLFSVNLILYKILLADEEKTKCATGQNL